MSYISTDEEEELGQDIFIKHKLIKLGKTDLIIGQNPGQGLACYSELGNDYFLSPGVNGKTFLAGKKIFALKKCVVFKCLGNRLDSSRIEF